MESGGERAGRVYHPAPVPAVPPTSGTGSLAPGLIPCAKCGTRVSDTAHTCPQCGERQPAAEGQEPGKRGARCGTCGTFNLVSSGYGRFESGNCRGCGCPLQDTNPDEFLDAEMDRVYEYSVNRSPVVPFLCGLFGTFVLVSRDWFPRTEKGDPSGVAVYVTLGALFLVFRALFARSARWHGIYNDDGLRSEVAGRMRDRSRDPVATRYARSRGSAGAGVKGVPWVAVGAVVVALGIGAVALYRAEFSQYELGRKAGVAHVRELSAKGPLVRAGMSVATVLDLIPSNPKATPDWNAGFRIGVKEELEHVYPEPKRR